MPTLTYTFVSRCPGGGHTVFDISFNGGPAKRAVYTTDEIRAPLSEMTEDQRDTLALQNLKAHMAGKTRAQIITELQSGPVTVTI